MLFDIAFIHEGFQFFIAPETIVEDACIAHIKFILAARKPGARCRY